MKDKLKKFFHKERINRIIAMVIVGLLVEGLNLIIDLIKGWI